MKKTRFFGRAALALALLLCLLLSACGGQTEEVEEPADPVEWCDTFVKHLGTPDEALQAALAGCIQQVDVQTGSEDGVTLRLVQTLGDERTLYLCLEAEFPEGALPEESAGQEGKVPLPAVTALFEGKLPYKLVSEDRLYREPEILSQLKEMGPALRDERINSNRLPTAQIFVEGERTGENSVCYLLCFNDSTMCMMGEQLTLLIGDFPVGETDGNEGVLYALTWDRKNEGESRRFDLKDDEGDMIGSAMLTSFSFESFGVSEVFSSGQDLANRIMLVGKDGKEIPLLGLWHTEETEKGRMSAGWHFPVPIDLTTVESVQIKP